MLIGRFWTHGNPTCGGIFSYTTSTTAKIDSVEFAIGSSIRHHEFNNPEFKSYTPGIGECWFVGRTSGLFTEDDWSDDVGIYLYGSQYYYHYSHDYANYTKGPNVVVGEWYEVSTRVGLYDVCAYTDWAQDGISGSLQLL